MKFAVYVLFFLSTYCFANSYEPCIDDKERLIERQNEVVELAKQDQVDREKLHSLPEVDWGRIQKNDLIRRKRIGEIFGEGCLVTAKDFANAALIFQHGDTPEHFWQAFVFSMHAIRLGDNTQRVMAANGIDRYLVHYTIGKKQLFARQATKFTGKQCYCLRQVEKSFPDSMRIAFTGKSYKDQLNWIKKLNEKNENYDCPNTECKEELKPTPKGSILGLW